MTDSEVVETPVSFDVLRKKMGVHSNAIISDILEFTSGVLPEKIEAVTSQIRINMINFLRQKEALDHEYLPGDGENSHFDNREKYRQNIGSVISKVLGDSEGSDIPVALQTVKDRLQEVLENNFR